MNHCNCTDGVSVAENYNRASSCVTPPTQLRTVTIPAKQGGDGEHDPYAPKPGMYQNTILIFRKTGSVYLFDVNGVPTNLTGTDYASTILELQEKVEKNSNDIENMNEELAKEIEVRTAEDANLRQLIESLSKGLADEEAARKSADADITGQLQSAQQQLNDVATKVDGNTTDLNQAVQDLEGKISAEATAREQGDQNLQSQVTQNTADIEALKEGEGGSGQAFAKELVLDLEAAEPTSNQVTLTATVGNLGTDITSTKDITLPAASETQAGILTADDYAKLASGGDLDVTVVTDVARGSGAGFAVSTKNLSTGVEDSKNVTLPTVSAAQAGIVDVALYNKLTECGKIKIKSGTLDNRIAKNSNGEQNCTFASGTEGNFTTTPVVFVSIGVITQPTTGLSIPPYVVASNITSKGFKLEWLNGSTWNANTAAWNTGNAGDGEMVIQWIAIGS